MTDPADVLAAARTIAVVGLSADPAKPAHRVPRALQERGWRIVPVNPRHESVLGERSYASVADLPDGVDVVEVFRPSIEAPDVVRAVVERGIGAVWLQLGIASEEARKVAEEAGVTYVEDACMGVVARHANLYPPS